LGIIHSSDCQVWLPLPAVERLLLNLMHATNSAAPCGQPPSNQRELFQPKLILWAS
jgi:hypothetical protein